MVVGGQTGRLTDVCAFTRSHHLAEAFMEVRLKKGCFGQGEVMIVIILCGLVNCTQDRSEEVKVKEDTAINYRCFGSI